MPAQEHNMGVKGMGPTQSAQDRTKLCELWCKGQHPRKGVTNWLGHKGSVWRSTNAVWAFEAVCSFYLLLQFCSVRYQRRRVATGSVPGTRMYSSRAGAGWSCGTLRPV